MIPYFCTVGKGLESFCVLELSTLNVHIHDSIIGKVFFSSKEPPDILLSLKTIERLFILVFNGKQILCEGRGNQALRKLKALVESDLVDWNSCLSNWLSYQKCSASRVQTSLSGHTNDCFNLNDSNINTRVRFRVSCKCSGNIRKAFHQQQLARVIGHCLVKTQAWKVDLRNPDVEVYVHAGDQFLILGLPVQKRPLSERPYLKHIKVRSTLCHAIFMAIGGFDSSSVVLDPMCGAATLLVEGAVSFPYLTFVGLDISLTQLEMAKENVVAAKVVERVHLLHADAVYLPLNDGYVSHVICDVPFGNKFGSINDVKRLLPHVLCSLNRVICLGGKLAFLISDTLTNFLGNSVHNLNTFLLANKSDSPVAGNNCVCQWITLKYYDVKLGELPANICVFEKKAVKFD